MKNQNQPAEQVQSTSLPYIFKYTTPKKNLVAVEEKRTKHR